MSRVSPFVPPCFVSDGVEAHKEASSASVRVAPGTCEPARVTRIRYRVATRPPQSRWRRDRVFPSRRKRPAVVLLVKSQFAIVIVSAHARRRQMKRRARGTRTARSSARRPRASYYASGAVREAARHEPFLVVVRDPVAHLRRLVLVGLPWCRCCAGLPRGASIKFPAGSLLTESNLCVLEFWTRKTQGCA